MRTTDLLLQGGGFSAIVLDMGSLAPEFVSRVPLATWFRYRAAAERTQSSILLLTQHACAKSSAELLLRFSRRMRLCDEATVFTGIEPHVEVARRRFTEAPTNVVPLRKPPQSANAASWQSRTTWAGADDQAYRTVCLSLCEGVSRAGTLRLRPELHSKPCVVMEGEPPFQQVCSLNTKARLLGMTHGMTRVEVDTFPSLSCCRAHAKRRRQQRAILLECAGAFSPRVEDRSEDTAFLCAIDIAGTKSLFGPPEMLARNLLAACQGTWHLSARHRQQQLPCGRLSCQRSIAASPFRVIAPGEEATALASLPLTVLDLTETQAETFALWGIHTLGMLAALPEKELIARMGQEANAFANWRAASCPHLFQPVEPAFTLEERMELDSQSSCWTRCSSLLASCSNS